MTIYTFSPQLAALVTLLCALTAAPLFAEKNAKLKPLLIEGKEQLDDAFDESPLGDVYAAVKGEWKIVDGALTGKELESDAHAAVLSCNVPNKDSLIQFSFKFDGASLFHLSFNHAEGHLFRIMLDEKSVAIRTDKDKQDSASKLLVLAKANTSFKKGQWYTMLVEVKGEEVALQIDNGVKLKGSHASINVDKPNYRFIVRGESMQIDDLKISQPAHLKIAQPAQN
jgi:hypothetical protein